jgi:hypothetical protein
MLDMEDEVVIEMTVVSNEPREALALTLRREYTSYLIHPGCA